MSFEFKLGQIIWMFIQLFIMFCIITTYIHTNSITEKQEQILKKQEQIIRILENGKNM